MNSKVSVCTQEIICTHKFSFKILYSYFAKLIFKIGKTHLKYKTLDLPMGSPDELYCPDRKVHESHALYLKSKPSEQAKIYADFKVMHFKSLNQKIIALASYKNTSVDSIMFVESYQCRGTKDIIYVFHTMNKNENLNRLLKVMRTKNAKLLSGNSFTLNPHDNDSVSLLKSFFVEINSYIKYVYDESTNTLWESR